MAGIPLIVVGASNFGRQIAQYIEEGGARVAGFLDDSPNAQPPEGYQILGTTGDYAVDDSHQFLIAVSDPTARKRIADRLTDRRAVLSSFIHPAAYVAKDAHIGAGSVICPLSHVGSASDLGENVLVNTYAMIGHDAIIGAHSALMGFAAINGGSQLGEGVFAGTSASVNPNRKVGSWSKIAAGSIVYQDMPGGVLVSGNPATALPLLGLKNSR